MNVENEYVTGELQITNENVDSFERRHGSRPKLSDVLQHVGDMLINQSAKIAAEGDVDFTGYDLTVKLLLRN